MNVWLICRLGHRWQLLDTEAPVAPGQAHCPICGAEEASRSEPATPEAATLPPQRALDPQATQTHSTFDLATPDTPSVLTGYEILEELGRGGMGVVYRARQLGLKRIVALKMILAGVHAGPNDLARFRIEAEAIARLQHPHIVQVYEVGEHEGRPYFSLEFCQGGSLEKMLQGTPLPPRQAAHLVRQLAEAMEAAHRAGIVHRDLKPANVLLAVMQKDSGMRSVGQEDSSTSGDLTSAIPKITDFGLARKLDEQGLTQTNAIIGTPSYMAPEQAEAKKDIGPAADIYSLGAILYECLTGRPPFRAATPLDTILQVISEEPAPPRLLQPNVPRDLETITLKCLSKDPARRYVSAIDLAADLGRFLANEPITAQRPSLLELTVRWFNKHQRAAILTAITMLSTVLLVACLSLLWNYLDQAQRGQLQLTTEGPALIAEILSQRDGRLTRVTVPMAEPLSLPAGPYRVQVWRPGDLSETWLLELERGFVQQFKLRVGERQQTRPVTLNSEKNKIYFIPKKTGHDLAVIEQYSRTLRLLDGATLQPRWSLAISDDTLPKGMERNVWFNLIWTSQPGLEPIVLDQVVDLDGDGFSEVVIGSTQHPVLLAVSGRDGNPLWWYRAWTPVPDGFDQARASYTAAVGGRLGNPGHADSDARPERQANADSGVSVARRFFPLRTGPANAGNRPALLGGTCRQRRGTAVVAVCSAEGVVHRFALSRSCDSSGPCGKSLRRAVPSRNTVGSARSGERCVARRCARPGVFARPSSAGGRTGRLRASRRAAAGTQSATRSAGRRVATRPAAAVGTDAGIQLDEQLA